MQNTTSLPKLAYSITEAMAVIGIGRTMLYEQIKAGNIRIVKVGRRTLITAAAISEWLESLEASDAGQEAA